MIVSSAGQEPASTITTPATTLGDTIGVYVHLPYCIQKCPYCDFNSYGIGKHTGSTPTMPEQRYIQALLTELSFAAIQPEWSGRTVHSIFLGGGTPSLFEPKSLGQVVTGIRDNFSVLPQIEVTMEANPGTLLEPLAQDRLMGFQACGINRLSMGAQSFQPKKLSFLGRIHSPEDTLKAIETVRAAGVENFNIDLIFGVGGESHSDWEQDLRTALSLNPSHISAYSLMIEPGTEFARRAVKGDLPLADDEDVAEMFATTRRLLTSSGLFPYETSNYAKRNRECRHNLGYWRGEDYLAIGAGAFGFAWDRQISKAAHGASVRVHPLSGSRYTNIPGPNDYMQRVESSGAARQRAERIDLAAAETEFFLLRLRLLEGFSVELYENTFGVNFQERFGTEIQSLHDRGMIEIHHPHIMLSEPGMMIANEVISELLVDIPPLLGPHSA